MGIASAVDVMKGFFSENYQAFRDLADRLDDMVELESNERQVVALIGHALKAISFHREEYDSLVSYKTRESGESFLRLAQGELDSNSLARLLVHLGSFIREATLMRESRSETEQIVLDYYLGVDRETPAGEWIGYSVDYVKTVLTFRLFERKKAEIAQLSADLARDREDAISKASELEERIQGHLQALGKLESEFNFVGLSHAFQSLLQQKRSDLRKAGALVVFLSLVALAGPLIMFSFGTGAGATWTPAAVTHLVAAVGIEIVLLYFFRIALRSLLLLRNQVTNLALRLALCQFIEGYVEFAEKASAAKNSGAFSGFEALIFGSLPSDDGNIPATLEGVEQAAKIIESLRKAG